MSESELDAVITNGQNQLDSTLVTDNRIDTDNTNLAFDLSYVRKLKKEGSQLSFNGHFTNFNSEFTQRIDSRYFDDNQDFLRAFGFTTDSEQNIDIYTGQIDYATPLGNTSFESGLRFSSVNSESSINFFDFSGNSDVVDTSLSDVFNYNEKIYAGYVSLVKNWEKWSMKLGLRGELTDAEGISLTQDLTNTQNFFKTFPSLYLLYAPSEKHSFAFDYGKKVDRPRYNDLNPFRNFINENDFVQGNQGLVPSFSNNFNFNYTFNSEFFFDIYYRDNGGDIGDFIFQNNSDLTLRELKQNVLESTSYGLDFTFSKSIIRPWALYAYVSLFHEDNTFIAEESGNVPFNTEVDGVYAYLGNYLTLSKDATFTGEVSLTYISSLLFGSFLSDEQIGLNLAAKKKPLEK